MQKRRPGGPNEPERRSPLKEVVAEAVALLEKGQSFALATIVRRTGSVPRNAGARMIIRCDGAIAGTVGGGALEAKVLKIAARVLEQGRAELMPFTLTPDRAASVGMICGGEGSVLIDYIDAGDPAARALYRELAAAIGNRTRAWLVTFLPEERSEERAGAKAGQPGRACLIRADGTITAVSGPVTADMQDIISQAGRYHTFTLLEQHQAVIEPVADFGTAWIFGAGHVSQSLAPVLSSVEFRTVVLDDRKEFANRERFGTADDIVLLESFADGFRGLEIGAGSYIIIVTRGHLHDRAVLEQALRTEAAYIGMIGSRGKRDQIFLALLDGGFTETDLKRVHSPIGLGIKAETPAEIAVSIAAELIRVRAELKERTP